MITTLVLKNFKSISEQTYDLTDFDLLVGRNNCGKSTILQAMAIWQFCVDEFHRAHRSGNNGIQIVLPNFTALPVPEFNLLWHEKIDRKYALVEGKRSKKPEYVLIEIELTWLAPNREPRSFGVQLRYTTGQSVYAIPMQGWKTFREMEVEPGFPKIAYVPPFSGLEPNEEWRDEGPLRKQVGKAQPGSILRNLLLKVCPAPPRDHSGRIAKTYEPPAEWNELQQAVSRWFSVELTEPKYERGVDTQILCEYKQGGKSYDIISGGSGFHQALTLLGFLYGYRPTTLLLDEPDAHMHVNLQREILDYFKKKARETGVQFLVATHAEELIKGVDPSQVVSILRHEPRRLTSATGVLTAMADVSNAELSQLAASPFILYVEGETDERILRAWAPVCQAADTLSKVCFHIMGGGTKALMKEQADRHYEGVRQVFPEARRLMLFDYDSDDSAFHPQSNNPALFEWGRKNIENYLLVLDAWMRTVTKELGLPEDDLMAEPARQVIRDFFANENLTLPRGQTWQSVSANVFKVVDGKKLLFDSAEALFTKLESMNPPIKAIREKIAGMMVENEIHEDVKRFFTKLREAANA